MAWGGGQIHCQHGALTWLTRGCWPKAGAQLELYVALHWAAWSSLNGWGPKGCARSCSVSQDLAPGAAEHKCRHSFLAKPACFQGREVRPHLLKGGALVDWHLALPSQERQVLLFHVVLGHEVSTGAGLCADQGSTQFSPAAASAGAAAGPCLSPMASPWTGERRLQSQPCNQLSLGTLLFLSFFPSLCVCVCW